jgi:hypothetical protein
VKDLLQGNGPIGKAVNDTTKPFFQDFVKATAPLMVTVGEALPYVKEIMPILQTLVDMYRAQGQLVEEYTDLKSYLNKIQVHDY